LQTRKWLAYAVSDAPHAQTWRQHFGRRQAKPQAHRIAVAVIAHDILRLSGYRSDPSAGADAAAAQKPRAPLRARFVQLRVVRCGLDIFEKRVLQRASTAFSEVLQKLPRFPGQLHSVLVTLSLEIAGRRETAIAVKDVGISDERERRRLSILHAADISRRLR